nr:MAG TPA: hypothetical protein [Caudoviricetes sp.]
MLKNFKRFNKIFVFHYFLVYLQMKIYKLNHKSIFT